MRKLGDTGIEVPALGLGAGPLGDPSIDDADAAALLDRAVAMGIGFVDTAPSYGRSEHRIAQLLRSRPDVIVSTKLGYGVPGVPDWTGPAITGGVDRALDRLGIASLPVAHLHSCPLATLRTGDVVEALIRAVEAGKVQVAAYSGEGEALSWAVQSGVFGVVQSSVSCCDPTAGRTVLAEARPRGIGVLAKRPLANGPWRTHPLDPDSPEAVYRQRWQQLGLDVEMPPAELMLRWAAYHPAVDVVLGGTTHVRHLEANVSAVARGPLPPDVQAHVEGAIDRVGPRWPGII